MKTYTRTPLQVRAVQWDGATTTLADIVAVCTGYRVVMNADHKLLSVETPTGIVRVQMGEWLVLEGDIASSYRDDSFKQLYTVPVAAKPKKK